MKKIILIAFLFLMPLTFVKAEEEEEQNHEVYLESIKINGYEFTPSFDKYNNVYTLIINEHIGVLDFEIDKEKEETILEIIGNENLHLGENEIQVRIEDPSLNAINVYRFLVTIEDNSDTTANFETIKETPRDIGMVEMSAIVFGCFLLILLTHKIIFRKKRR